VKQEKFTKQGKENEQKIHVENNIVSNQDKNLGDKIKFKT